MSAPEMAVAACISGQDHVAGVSGYALTKAVRLIHSLPVDARKGSFGEVWDATMALLPSTKTSEAETCRAEARQVFKLYDNGSEAVPFKMSAEISSVGLTTRSTASSGLSLSPW